MKLPNGRTMIGDRMLSVTYRKGQKHACDPACRRAGHVYRHVYKKPIPLMAGTRGEVRVPAREFTRRDGTIEHYAVDNPPLLIVNGPKSTRRKVTMATYKMRRNGKGQFVAVRNAPRKKSRKKARRNPAPFWSAGAVINAPRHRKSARRATSRRARRNPPRTGKVPEFLGIPLALPEVADVLAITGGLAGPPLVKGFAMQLLPASVTNNTMGKYAVEAGSYVLPAVAGYMIGGRRALRMVLAGEAAAVGVRLVGQLTATISSALPSASVGSYMRQAKLLNGRARPGVRGYIPADRAGISDFTSSRRSGRTSQLLRGKYGR